ncbi:hypothetical protein [Natronorubrum halophilum]|uniref:hypothetical protein n=1 Tax=Natronorubrum halophilum TaxID=1702106 RepID=UPI000EF70268|nr:hypothetical protein [Natronorubrum halophilum]
MVDRRKIAVALLVFVAAAGAGYALTSDYTLGSETHLEASNGPEVVLSSDTITNSQQPFPDSNTVYINPHGTISSDGPTHVRVDQWGSGSGWTQLSEIDASNELEINISDRQTVSVQGDVDQLEYGDITVDDGHQLTINQTGTTTLRVHDIGEAAAIDSDTGELLDVGQTDSGVTTFDIEGSHNVEFTSPDGGPVIDDGSAFPTGEQSTAPDELAVNVSSETGGDIEVEFTLDGDVVGTDTVASGERASVSITEESAGIHNWSVTATDIFGDNDSSDYQYGLPNELEIRDEETGDLITNETEVRFFPSGDEDEVFTRNTTTGVVDMTGLPVDTRLIVDAQTDGYHPRQLVLDSLVQQSSIYLLNESSDTVLTEFEIIDRTNDFGAEDGTHLKIQRAIQLDGEDNARYRTVMADEIGANGRVDAYLSVGDRYRLVVENEDGQSRSLGSYTAEREELVQLEIGNIDITQPADDGYVFSAGMADEEEFGENMVKITYADDAGLTSELEYFIHARGNENDVVSGVVTVDDPTSYSELVEVPENGTYSVTWTADRDGEEIGGTLPVGTVGPLDLPISSTTLQALGLSALVLLGGLFGGSMSRTGAIVLVVLASGMRMLGIVSLPYPLLVAAGVVALMFKIGDARYGT